jgi:hypothetical protein
MITYSWSILEIFCDEDNLTSVCYLISGLKNGVTVQSKGQHTFENGTVTKPLSEIVESDLIQWIEKDTTKNDINPIKLAIEDQLKALETTKKVDFPWLSGTFTIE